jgi:FkbM family methyltransferase
MLTRRIFEQPRRQITDLSESAKNARRSFRPGEVDYRLALRNAAGLTVAYRAGTSDEAVLADSFDHDIFLPRLPEYQPAAADVVIDVGAHIGTFTMLVAAKVAHVYAIEASEETFNYLELNRLANRLDNVTTIHCALAERDGTTTLAHDRGNWGHSIMLRGRGETVPTRSLESIMEQHHIPACTFLRMNCEGAEFPILITAAPEVLGRVQKMLVLFHADIAKHSRLEDLTKKLTHVGFHLDLRERSQDGLRGWIVATR